MWWLKVIILHCEVNKSSSVWQAANREQIDGFISDQVEKIVCEDSDGSDTPGYEHLQNRSKLIRTLQILSGLVSHSKHSRGPAEEGQRRAGLYNQTRRVFASKIKSLQLQIECWPCSARMVKYYGITFSSVFRMKAGLLADFPPQKHYMLIIRRV